MDSNSYPVPTQDLASFNSKILDLDLDEIEVEALEQRIEMAVAMIVADGPMDPDSCNGFSCTGFMPAL